MKFDYIEVTIGSHFLCALINADSSGLDDDEDTQLANWEADIIMTASACAAIGPGHWSYGHGTDEFGLCDVTGLRGDVETVRYMFPIA